MNPEIVERPKLILAGITASSKDVSGIDIHNLWEVYGQFEPGLQHRVDGVWYELHVGVEQGKGIYSVTVGAEIAEIIDLPIEGNLKILPAGKYAHFAHKMKGGGYGDAFANVERWVEESGTAVQDFGLQLYDNQFDPEDGESILHIYIPLA